jgi:hypothetical protein
VIGAALGGALTTDAFCGKCNELFGKEIDAPIAQLRWIQELRHRHGVRDRYRRVPPPPRVAATVGGRSAAVTMASERWELEIFPTEEVVGNTLRFSVAPEREEEFLAKKLKRLKRDHRKVDLTSRVVDRFEPVAEFTETWRVDMWARLTAKITLGIAASLSAWDWRHSDAGQYVAALALGGAEAVGEAPPDAGVTGMPRVLEAGDLTARVVVPPRHLIWLDERGEYLAIVLFGQFQLAAHLAGRLGSNRAWLFEPRTRSVETASFGALFGRLISEMTSEGPTAAEA